MDRIAVVELPDILQMGFSAPLLFFDKMVLPDEDYVFSAFEEIGNPDSFATEEDPDSEMTVAEVRMGLGYHLWGGQERRGDLSELEYLFEEIESLRSKGFVESLPYKRELSPLDSFRALGNFVELDEQRIQTVLQTAKQDFVDVCTVRHKPDHTSLTTVPRRFDKTDVIQLLLKNIPLPPDEIPTDELIDFKKDSQADLYRLRGWMEKTTKEHDSLEGVEDEYRASWK